MATKVKNDRKTLEFNSTIAGGDLSVGKNFILVPIVK
jgi:hypothetical protein